MKFKDQIISYFINKVLAEILQELDEKQIKAFLDSMIDKLESLVEDSENKFDDALLPVLRLLRDYFNVPDLPDSV